MKHLTRQEMIIRRLLDRARTIAVVGASPRPERHSHAVFRYLRSVGYDVVPVRADRREVDGLPSYPTIEVIPGQVDLAVVFRRAEGAPAAIASAAAKRVEAAWLPPGVWSHDAEREAMQDGLLLIKDHCIERDHGHVSQQGGHPIRSGVWMSRRGRPHTDNRKRWSDTGYVEGGGGGHNAGGGKHTVLDEKKMARGRPSPRRGPQRPYK
jgi:predicted CoA-binding protein